VVQSQLGMQLARGFFTKEDRVPIQSRLRDVVKDQNQTKIEVHAFQGTTNLLTFYCARPVLTFMQADKT
jgi:hypothetical protein